MALLAAGVLQTREYAKIPEFQSGEAAAILTGLGGLLIALSARDEVVLYKEPVIPAADTTGVEP